MPLKQNPLSYISLDQGADFGFSGWPVATGRESSGASTGTMGTANCKLKTANWTLRLCWDWGLRLGLGELGLGKSADYGLLGSPKIGKPDALCV